jgi:uncharacterized protein (TIGR03435 family)
MLLLQQGETVTAWIVLLALAQTFDVASLKPADTNAVRSTIRGGPGTSDPGQITFTNATLSAIVQRAYGLENYQLTGPDWLATRRYDIAAKLPPGATKDDCSAMLRNLLTERLHLSAHREQRDLQGFDLVLAGNVAKLKPAAPAAEPGITLMESLRGKSVISILTAKAQPLSALVKLLTREFRLPISDKTGLTAEYDFTLEFAPQKPGAIAPAESADTDAANLITAVREQLGLRLQPARVRATILIVDSADALPTAN